MTIQVVTRFPAATAINAARETYVFVSVSGDAGGFDANTLRMAIDGVVAYEHGRFVAPAFDGEALVSNNYIALRTQPRRQFDYAATVQVETDVSDAAHATALADVFAFTVADRPPTLVNGAQLAPCQLRFVTAFPDAYLDAFRQVLGSGLSPDPRLVTSAAVYRLEQSLARPLAVSLQTPAPPALLDRDLAPLLPLAAQLQAVLPLWEPALGSLRALGVGPQTAETLRRAMASGYPQNQVGAACGATLLAAAFYAAQGL